MINGLKCIFRFLKLIFGIHKDKGNRWLQTRHWPKVLFQFVVRKLSGQPLEFLVLVNTKSELSHALAKKGLRRNKLVVVAAENMGTSQLQECSIILKQE